jgi:hypothetical protein
MLPFDAVEDMNKIIDLRANIPEKLKPVLKKNATNDILTTEITSDSGHRPTGYIPEYNQGLTHQLCFDILLSYLLTRAYLR